MGLRHVGQLRAEAAALREALDEARTTVRADAPRLGEDLPACIELLADALDDLLGTVDELRRAARSLDPVGGTPPTGLVDDLARLAALRVSLWTAYRALTSFEVQAPVAALSRERGVDWRVWSALIREGLARLEGPLVSLTAALDACGRDALLLLAAGRPDRGAPAHRSIQPGGSHDDELL